MCRRAAIYAVFFGLILSNGELCADDSDKIINADLKKLCAASVAGDVKVSTDMMYSPVVKLAGGREAMEKLGEEAEARMRANHSEILRCEPIPPYQKFTTSVNDYVVIPCQVSIATGFHRTEWSTFNLAIRPRGTTKWEYLDGFAITPKLKSLLFPDLKDTILPTVTRKVIF